MRSGIAAPLRQALAVLVLAGAAALAAGPAPAQNNRPPRPGPAPESAAPAAPDPAKPDASQPAGRRKILDELFDKLVKAPDERTARGIAVAIERMWMRSGSDTSDLLMTRAMQAMQAKDYTLTQELLDRVLEILPGWAEAHNKRATAKFLMEDYGGAMEDIAQVLKLEPRHYGALAGAGFILQKTENDKGALQLFRRALELYPIQDEIRKIVEKLGPGVDGQDI